jgi:hypothetical protein
MSLVERSIMPKNGLFLICAYVENIAGYFYLTHVSSLHGSFGFNTPIDPWPETRYRRRILEMPTQGVDGADLPGWQ